MSRYQPTEIINSMHMKILSVKRDLLKDSVVFVCLDEDQFGQYDLGTLAQIAEQLDDIEPSGSYFLVTKKYNIRVYDRSEFKNKDLIVTYSIPDEHDKDKFHDLTKAFNQAIPEAKSISFINYSAEIGTK
jgi:hypothetical protein